MPEMPEVHAFMRYIKDTSLDKNITGIKSSAKKLIKKITFDRFKKKLIGNAFKDAFQQGKYAIIKLKKGSGNVVMHFGLTGSLHYCKQNTPKEGEDKYTKVTFEFGNGYELRWINKRKFGVLYFVDSLDEISAIKSMGPDPLSLRFSDFQDILYKHAGQNIKSFLMDQKNLAGIGNEYSDEILFQAEIYPKQTITSLSKSQQKKLFSTMQNVLKKAIEKRSASKSMPKSWLINNRKKESTCPKNGHKLKNEKIAGRSAYWCPIHQKKSA